MKKLQQIIIFFLVIQSGFSQFPPAANKPGTTAISADSSVFVNWATGCTVIRGWKNIADTTLGVVTNGIVENSFGKADFDVVSLGDGGIAILTFDKPVINEAGFDFAIFENGFSDYFLELAFVEVSSDGENYFRFPAISNTQTEIQVATFDTLNPTKIHNFAGKYKAFYGTPFDLEDLKGTAGLDLKKITHIKVIDVTGSISDQYASFDINGAKINDPYPTPFDTGGFDLDAVGIIHQAGTGETSKTRTFSIYPNPSLSGQWISITSNNTTPEITDLRIFSITGKEILFYTGVHNPFIFSAHSGFYFVSFYFDGIHYVEKLVVE